MMFSGRDAIVAFLTRKWQRELDYRLIKEVWAFRRDRIAVRFQYDLVAVPPAAVGRVRLGYAERIPAVPGVLGHARLERAGPGPGPRGR